MQTRGLKLIYFVTLLMIGSRSMFSSLQKIEVIRYNKKYVIHEVNEK